jgi:8-oxo-dGTP pyrophosphatase MutT (NUDIX family)
VSAVIALNPLCSVLPHINGLYMSKIMTSEKIFYRIVTNSLGVYEAVERDCPRDDSRRSVKPDGNWLQKAGARYPGLVSYWTELGLEKYISSGLFDWHRSVVNTPIEVIKSRLNAVPTYQDDLQIISDKADFAKISQISINQFFEDRGGTSIINKVGIFVTRMKNEPELLVFRHIKFPELGIQFPAGTIEEGETPSAAAVRELKEESGLEIENCELFGTYTFFKVYCNQFQRRHVYHGHLADEIGDSWTHTVNSDGDDSGLEFEFSWQPISKLDPDILKIEGVGDSLRRLSVSLSIGHSSHTD